MIASLDRINELATKNRTEGLNEAELLERDMLRQEYLMEIRGQLSSTITSITVMDESGQDVTPSALVVEKTKQMQNEFDF